MVQPALRARKPKRDIGFILMILTQADLLAVERELCRRSLAEFAKRAWKVLEPAAELKWGWALDAICLHLDAVYARYFENMRDGAVIYVAHADLERVAFTDCFVKAGLKLSQILVWAKQSGTLSRQDFNWKHEPILYGWREGAGHYFCKDFTLTTVIDDDLDIDKLKKDEMVAMLKQIKEQMPTTVIQHDRPTKSDLHPTMKPVGLVQRMVEWSSMDGWIVLDLFGGSGSTMIACEKTHRKSRLMELDPKYCDVIVTRWQQFTGKHAYLEADGRSFTEVMGERSPNSLIGSEIGKADKPKVDKAKPAKTAD